MKYQTRYKTIIASLIASLSVLGLTTVAMAQDTNSVISASAAAQQMQVQIGGNGNAVLRGTVVAVGTGSITVKSWGGDWVVNVASTTNVTPHATSTSANNLSLVNVGGFVTVQGTVSTSSAWTINAKNVHVGVDPRSTDRNREDRQMNSSGRRDVEDSEKSGKSGMGNNIFQAVMKKLDSKGKGNKGGIMGQNMFSKVFEGKVSNVGATSFTLTKGSGTAYTVNVASTTKLINKNSQTVSGLSLVQANDKVRVTGSLSGTVITALVVRDTSIPR